MAHISPEYVLSITHLQISTPTLKLLSWNHTTIEFISPEGDGRNWDLSLTCGGQTNQKLDSIE